MAIVFSYVVATNIVTVTGGTSGTPATFADFVTADRAGTGTSLRAATAGTATVTLTYPVRPVELRAIVVKCVVAAKTAEADFIFITGTDAWDAAQTESIDVTAGNGTYTTTKRWRTITNIDCSDNAAGGGTIWADGTIAVTQDIWGVIWDLTTDVLNCWKWDCAFSIGNGSTATYFACEHGVLIADVNKWATGDYADFLPITANATFRLGKIVSESLKQTNGKVAFMVTTKRDYTPSAQSVCYGTLIAVNTDFYDSGIGGVVADVNFILAYGSADTKVWHCTFHGVTQINGYGPGNFYNIRFLGEGAGYGLRWPSNEMTLSKVDIQNHSYSTYFTWGSENISLRDVVSKNTPGFLTYHNQNTYHGVIDAEVESWDNSFVGDTINFKLYRRYSININVSDKSGTAIENATVRMENKNAAYTNDTETKYGFEVVTDVNGDIAEQIVSRGYYADDAPDTLIDLSPHKFTISKAGYQTLVLENITIDAPIKWHLELQNTMNNNFSHMGRMNS